MAVETLSQRPDIRTSTVAVVDRLGDPEPPGWRRAVRLLRSWMWGMPIIEEEGLVPPSQEVIDVAIKVAHQFSEQGMDAPSRVIPNGEGGIMFERYLQSGDSRVLETVEVFSDRQVEFSKYDNSSLKETYFLSIVE